MDLQDKVALITGGGTGLGKEIARLYAGEGMKVAVNYSRSRQEAEETAAELCAMGVEAITVQADVAKVAEVNRMVAEVGDKFGRLDVLVNNAGVTRFVPFHNLDGLDEEDWDDLLNINTKAPFFAVKAAVPLMRQNGGGVIINTTSIAGSNTAGSSLAYCASKAALNHLTRCLAVALGPDIRVNGVAPGLLITRWGEKFGEEKIKAFEQKAVLKKATSVPETAAFYVLLAKNESITGQIITVDAGITLG